jgi:N-methylhydantoinase A
MKHATYRVGVDIGGTFTDIVLLSEGDQNNAQTVAIGKVLTTPQEPAQAVLQGVKELLERHALAPERTARTSCACP